MAVKLDVITMGRSCVDLYGAQIGGELEEMRSFEKYIGGSPTNIACGSARLGLRTGLITGVGDEYMGRFILRELERHGIDISGVKVDSDRLTALAMLGIRDEEQFPLIFFRENCADMALSADDIDEAFIASTRALVITGTHLSQPQTEEAVLTALRYARKAGARTALDIDFRPNLWGLATHGQGEERFVASDEVTSRLQAHLHLFDLIVGTEEEFHIAGGSTDTIAALRAVRARTDAILVCKRGAMGAAAFEGHIPESLDDGQSGRKFAIEVFNVLGAGDGFMAGLLKGWLDDLPWAKSIEYANACGAIAVSRHGCTPAYPSLQELEYFLKTGIKNPALRMDQELEQLHWSTTRPKLRADLCIFAFDHRAQFEAMDNATPEKIGAFKSLCLDAALKVADGRDGFGILCDNRLGRQSLHRAMGTGLWVGRPVEWPSSRPLAFEPELGPDLGGLVSWPSPQACKALCFYHPDDPDWLKNEQETTIIRLFHACRRNSIQFVLEVIASGFGQVDEDTTARTLRRFYELGVYPDFWKLEPMQTEAAWDATCQVINEFDPHCNGVLILGLGGSADSLKASFQLAAKQPLVRGFAVGRTIFADVAQRWLNGEVGDEAACKELTRGFAELSSNWQKLRASCSVGSRGK
ncbi:5-dehydro-2-deoxygluconokinase [Falsihalocynthiibacter sp. SS001]|uniref:bifunctional 5-dehydro-2-deoxygluconokinase/5-dehydro-2- deoxyphosphogluconate aldolase n=1 Tax=Falsihalocynthiibacter sp. SS001 TaxID=3349698 RepID=UPI0036D3DC3B